MYRLLKSKISQSTTLSAIKTKSYIKQTESANNPHINLKIDIK